MRIFGLLMLSGMTLLAQGGENPQRKVLVELFTSQGCSSCPPAEARLAEALKGELAQKAVVLSWHVDYWDYLGWRDAFASPESTRRQEEVVRALKLPGLQTPQFIVNGRALNDSNALLERVKEAAADVDIAIELAVSVNGSDLRAEFKLTRVDHEIAWPKDLRVVPVLFQRQTRVAIKAGENKGRELTGMHVVRAVGKSVSAEQAVSRKSSVVFEIPAGVDAAQLGVAILIEDPKTLRSYGCESK